MQKKSGSEPKRERKRKPSKPTVPKWQIVENVVAASERIRASAPETKVTQKVLLPSRRDSTASREIDVLIEAPVGDRKFRIGVDVKNETRPIDTEKMGTLVEKFQDVCLDRYCVVSTSGFSVTAKRKAEWHGIEATTLEEFYASEVFAAPLGQLVRRPSIRLKHTMFHYEPSVLEAHEDELRSTILGKCPDDIIFHDDEGSQTLSKCFEPIARRHASSLSEAGDEMTVFSVKGDVLPHHKFTVHGTSIIRPEFIVATFEYHRDAEMVPENRFRLGGIEMSTVIIDGRQHTLAAIPQPEGGFKLALSVGDAQPKRGG